MEMIDCVGNRRQLKHLRFNKTDIAMKSLCYFQQYCRYLHFLHRKLRNRFLILVSLSVEASSYGNTLHALLRTALW